MEWIIGIFVVWLISTLSRGSSPPPKPNEDTTSENTELQARIEKLVKAQRAAMTSATKEAEKTEFLHDDDIELPAHSLPVLNPKTIKARRISREEEIESFSNNRGIVSLIHFTHAENLPNILTHGLIGRRSLNSSSIASRFNDQYRFDNVPDAISMSISFPNYKMLYSLRSKNEEIDWVIVKLNPSILWEANCAFCASNAATSKISAVPLAQRQEVESLRTMFDDFPPPRTRENLRIPDRFPTDPQAEVLVLETIHPRYIQSINFDEKSRIHNYQRCLELAGPYMETTKFFHDKSLFKPRQDFQYW